MPKKAVLFIQPFQFVKKKLSNELMMWFVYLSNYLEHKIKNNLKTDVLYLPLENTNEINLSKGLTHELVERLYSILDKAITNIEFDLGKNTYICISAGSSFDYIAVKLIAEYFQKNFQEARIIIGGYHATSRSKDFNSNNSPTDYIVEGEGEISLFKLCSKNSLKKRKRPVIIQSNPISDLNELAPLDLSIIDKYIDNIKRKIRGLAIALSRGCPHSCSYCIEFALRKKHIKNWREYKPERALQEVNTLTSYGLNHGIKIYGFLDPVFGYNKKWLDEFLDDYEVDDQIETHFVETRADFLDEPLLKKLQAKKMFQFYGLENFDKRLLSIMQKTHNPTKYLEKFKTLFEIHKKLNYPCTLGILFNHPAETRESYKNNFDQLEDIARNDKNNLINFSPNLYHFFPKTKNYDEIEVLHTNYGTKAYFPEWWVSTSTLEFGPFCIRPCSDLSLRESIEIFTENHIKLDKIRYEKNKKDGFAEFFLKASAIKRQKNQILKLLDKYDIEMEDNK